MNSNHYITGLVLSRPSLGKPYQWLPVRGTEWVDVRSGWKDVSFFVYRDGRICIVVDTATGVAVTHAPSVPTARAALILFLHNLDRQEYLERVKSQFEEAIKEAGPRPDTRHVNRLLP